MDKFDKSLIVCNDSGELGEMPRVPLSDPHGESVDILVAKFKQADGLDNRFILTVHIKRNFVSWESVRKAESWLFEFNVLEFFMLEEINKMLS